MKTSRLLNRSLFLALFFFFISINTQAENQPVDIWNIEKKKTENNLPSNEKNLNDDSNLKKKLESDIYKMQSQKKFDSIELDQSLKNQNINEAIILAKKALIKNPEYVEYNYRKEQLWGEKLQSSTEKLFENKQLKNDILLAKTKI